MKTNTFLTISSNAALRIMFLGYIVLLAHSCTTSKSKKAEPEQNSGNQVLCDESVFMTSDPRSSDQTTCGIKLFQTMYQINNDTIKDSIQVKCNNMLVSKFMLHPNSSSKGLVFHYGVNDNKQIVYIVSSGELTSTSTIDDVSYSPFDHDKYSNDDYYILLDDSIGEPISIDSINFCHFKNNYSMYTKIKDSKGKYGNIDTDTHPLLIFHEGSELQLFYKEYYKAKPLYLYLGHGADIGQDMNTPFHVPYLIFGNDERAFPLDNVDYELTFGINYRYHHKSLDAGNLCPPYCGAQPNHNCQIN